MRLVAVDVTPKGDLVIVGGKNGAGKSSVLDSIAMALGGMALCPMEPIRKGESTAEIKLDLGDLRVIRRFKREPIRRDEDKAATPSNIVAWTEVQSSLIVTNADGAVYPSPQKMLDNLLGKLTFDPLAFATEGKTSEGRQRQDQTLRRLVGIDVAPIEARRKTAYDERAMLKKTLTIKEVTLSKLPFHADAPAVEIPMDEISTELTKAEDARRLAMAIGGDAAVQAREVIGAEEQVKSIQSKIEELELKLGALQNQLIADQDALKFLQKEQIEADAKSKEAWAAVPDVAVIQKKLTEVEATNAKVRANQERAKADADSQFVATQIEERTALIEAAEKEKLELLKSTKFPVEGLGLGDSGVTFNGLPFSQASSAEQLRVSVAIGLALNPKLKVLLIRSGNLLDDDSLKLVAEQAEAADAQVWMEYVTANPEGVSVMIEDGHVAEQES
jgi:DNA repair exonuclease SbcCD ATPase subunit